MLKSIFVSIYRRNYQGVTQHNPNGSEKYVNELVPLFWRYIDQNCTQLHYVILQNAITIAYRHFLCIKFTFGETSPTEWAWGQQTSFLYRTSNGSKSESLMRPISSQLILSLRLHWGMPIFHAYFPNWIGLFSIWKTTRNNGFVAISII